jgi:hypothetical protein
MFNNLNPTNCREFSKQLRPILTYYPPVRLEVLKESVRGKRPLGRPKRRWVDNIKMNLNEIGWDGMDLIDLAQDRDQWRALVNTVMNLRVP